MAYAGALFADACLRGLNGDPDVVVRVEAAPAAAAPDAAGAAAAAVMLLLLLLRRLVLCTLVVCRLAVWLLLLLLLLHVSMYWRLMCPSATWRHVPPTPICHCRGARTCSLLQTNIALWCPLLAVAEPFLSNPFFKLCRSARTWPPASPRCPSSAARSSWARTVSQDCLPNPTKGGCWLGLGSCLYHAMRGLAAAARSRMVHLLRVVIAVCQPHNALRLHSRQHAAAAAATRPRQCAWPSQPVSCSPGPAV